MNSFWQCTKSSILMIKFRLALTLICKKLGELEDKRKKHFSLLIVDQTSLIIEFILWLYSNLILKMVYKIIFYGVQTSSYNVTPACRPLHLNFSMNNFFFVDAPRLSVSIFSCSLLPILVSFSWAWDWIIKFTFNECYNLLGDNDLRHCSSEFFSLAASIGRSARKTSKFSNFFKSWLEETLNSSSKSYQAWPSKTLRVPYHISKQLNFDSLESKYQSDITFAWMRTLPDETVIIDERTSLNFLNLCVFSPFFFCQ